MSAMAEEGGALHAENLSEPEEEEERKDSKRFLWRLFSREPDFFNSIVIDKSSFDEVPVLRSNTRYFTACMAFLFLLANMYSLIIESIRTIIYRLSQENKDGSKPYLMSRQLFSTLFNWTIPGEALLAAMELVLGLSLFCWMCCQVVKFCSSAHEAWRWTAAGHLALDVVPMSTNMSSMKLLHFVSKQVFRPQLKQLMKSAKIEGPRKHSLNIAWFLLSRLFCAFVGLDAFLYKFQHLAFRFVYHHDDRIPTIFYTLVFLNQILGIVQVGLFTFDRLFSFAFAGENGYLSPEEQTQMRIWKAMFLREVWQNNTLTRPQSLSISLSFTDTDFQRLIFDTNRGIKGYHRLPRKDE